MWSVFRKSQVSLTCNFSNFTHHIFCATACASFTLPIVHHGYSVESNFMRSSRTNTFLVSLASPCLPQLCNNKIIPIVTTSATSPLLKNHENSANHHEKSGDVIPFNLLVQVEDGKRAKDHQSDCLLNRFQLCSGKFIRSDTICRNLKAILKKRYAPTGKNGEPNIGATVF